MKMSCAFSVAGALVLAIGLAGVFAAEPPTSEKKAIERAASAEASAERTRPMPDLPTSEKKAIERAAFAEASAERAQLMPEIEQLKTELDELKSQKRNMSALQAEKRDAERRITMLKQELDRAKKTPAATAEENKSFDNPIQSIQAQLDDENSRSDSIKQYLGPENSAVKTVDDMLKSKQDELTHKQARLNAVQHRINELLNSELPRQNFKFWMSATFAALVGLVIIGFFFIAWGDERVRQAIFSGTAGIQFVTLFSLVIAIILFGIIEILEGKELAALLGGLSGYILGRATSEHASAQPEQPSRDQSIPLGTQPPVPTPPALQLSVGNGAAQHVQP